MSLTPVEFVQERVAAAQIESSPGPHLVVNQVLPPHIYAELLDTIPAEEAFTVSDKVKSNFEPSKASNVPTAWRRFDEEIVAGLAPILVGRFRPALWAMYDEALGRDAADYLIDRQRAFMGRLMLRRPGYRLKPHRDTRIVALTGLVYCARLGDSTTYGTELYAVDGDGVAPSWKTYYPINEHGATVTLVKSVPFTANTMLVFSNTRGMAHAAAIPPDATQTERYAYQFYVGPCPEDYERFMIAR